MRFALVVFSDILYMEFEKRIYLLHGSVFVSGPQNSKYQKEIFAIYYLNLLVMIYNVLYSTILSIVELREKLVLKGCKVTMEIR